MKHEKLKNEDAHESILSLSVIIVNYFWHFLHTILYVQWGQNIYTRLINFILSFIINSVARQRVALKKQKIIFIISYLLL